MFNFYHGNSTIDSLRTAVELHLAVNNINEIRSSCELLDIFFPTWEENYNLAGCFIWL
jgi:hypothetical protein